MQTPRRVEEARGDSGVAERGPYDVVYIAIETALMPDYARSTAEKHDVQVYKSMYYLSILMSGLYMKKTYNIFHEPTLQSKKDGRNGGKGKRKKKNRKKKARCGRLISVCVHTS